VLNVSNSPKFVLAVVVCGGALVATMYLGGITVRNYLVPCSSRTNIEQQDRAETLARLVASELSRAGALDISVEGGCSSSDGVVYYAIEWRSGVYGSGDDYLNRSQVFGEWHTDARVPGCRDRDYGSTTLGADGAAAGNDPKSLAIFAANSSSRPCQVVYAVVPSRTESSLTKLIIAALV